MRRVSTAAAFLAVAALPLALTACSSGGSASGGAAKSAAGTAATPSVAATPEDPNAGLATGARLKTALAPASFFGPGYALDASATRDSGSTYQEPSSAPASAGKPDCGKLAGTSWIAITGDTGVSFAQDDYANKNTSAEMAQEVDVFRGTTASTVLKHLKKAVAACPAFKDGDTKTTAKVKGAATRGLGDEAYTITVTDPAWQNGTTLIAVRRGTAVVTVLSTAGHDNGAATAKKLAARVTTAAAKVKG
ncbi:hypothetical protein [Streptomyces sp. NPDC057910]|uniref:hypothetical protein n=1 Tax=Streptomyces sp. NPDC057910 TaxID=3346278 RepID=UPI0036E1E5BF